MIKEAIPVTANCISGLIPIIPILGIESVYCHLPNFRFISSIISAIIMNVLMING